MSNTSSRSGKILYDTVVDVLQDGSTNAYEIKLTIYGPNLPHEIIIHPDYIEQLVIDQNFLNKYASEETIKFKVTGWEYVTLLRGYQDLHATIVLSPVHYIFGYNFTTAKITIINYLAIIENAENILKELPVGILLPQPEDDNDTVMRKKNIRLDLQLQLIDEKVYQLRLPKLNCILKDSPVESAINYVAEVFDIDNVRLAPIENTTPIQNLIIPPFQSFAQVLQTIQKDYGIYMKDVSHFYMFDTLYIYPAAETECSFYDNIPINIYKIAPDDFMGLEKYCSIKYGQFHIVSPQTEQKMSSSEKAKENQGEASIMLDATKLMDNLKQSDSVNTEIKNDHLQYIGVNNPRGVTSTGQNIQYGGVITNPMKSTATIGNTQMDVMTAIWNIANIQFIHPKHPVTYHYINADGYQIQRGSIAGVVYTFSKSSQPANWIYRCTAGITMMLTPLENS
jgi:hypothetical protein